MRIIILGWGSLIWNPRELPRDGEWRQNGPKLPIEFSRISKDGRLTLVVDHDNGAIVPTRYILSPRTCISDAREDLQQREGTPSREQIGFVNLVHGTSSADELSEKNRMDEQIAKNERKTCEIVKQWLIGNHKPNYDGAVWTSLRNNFAKELELKEFTPKHAVKYLINLPPTVRKEAFKYIFSAPPEVDTQFRKAIQRNKEFKSFIKSIQR